MFNIIFSLLKKTDIWVFKFYGYINKYFMNILINFMNISNKSWFKIYRRYISKYNKYFNPYACKWYLIYAKKPL